MPLDSVLARIPGYGGYAARRAQIEEGDARELKQAMTLKQILDAEAFRQKQLEQQMADRAATRDATSAYREGTMAQQSAALQSREQQAQAEREARAAALQDRLRSDAALKRELATGQQQTQRDIAAGREATQRELAAGREATAREMAQVKNQTSPAAVKERDKIEGRTAVSALLDELKADYEELEKQGSDISPQRNAVQNVYNRIASSGAGQLVAGAVGTKSQETRDSIASKRAALMASIKQATGMGATQLNSDRELMFYLKMATDPTMARGANQKAIDWLKNTYGLKEGTAAPAAPAATGGLSQQEQQELDALRKRFGR